MGTRNVVGAKPTYSTMKIIKPGIKHKKVYRGECRDCQGVFEWNREELSDCIYDERERQELCHVVCPECGSIMFAYYHATINNDDYTIP